MSLDDNAKDNDDPYSMDRRLRAIADGRGTQFTREAHLHALERALPGMMRTAIEMAYALLASDGPIGAPLVCKHWIWTDDAYQRNRVTTALRSVLLALEELDVSERDDSKDHANGGQRRD